MLKLFPIPNEFLPKLAATDINPLLTRTSGSLLLQRTNQPMTSLVLLLMKILRKDNKIRLLTKTIISLLPVELFSRGFRYSEHKFQRIVAVLSQNPTNSICLQLSLTKFNTAPIHARLATTSCTQPVLLCGLIVKTCARD
ncbi:hypothetical protein Mapa_010646 [Marchantia paleacea]|nr:hypothetical protein Mapa_010646 [Marchantia paleacea]